MTMSVLLREGFEGEVALERAGGVGGGEIGFQVNRQGRETIEIAGRTLRAVHENSLLKTQPTQRHEGGRVSMEPEARRILSGNWQVDRWCSFIFM